MTYVEEFLYRGRHAEREPGKEAVYHVVLATWMPDTNGVMRQIKTDPLTPAQALAAGFSLQTIVGQIADAAMLDAGKAYAKANKLQDERDTAYAEANALMREVSEYKADKDLATSMVAAYVSEKNQLRFERDTLAQEVARLSVPAPAPSKPLLNTLTFGLLGN